MNTNKWLLTINCMPKHVASTCKCKYKHSVYMWSIVRKFQCENWFHLSKLSIFLISYEVDQISRDSSQSNAYQTSLKKYKRSYFKKKQQNTINKITTCSRFNKKNFTLMVHEHNKNCHKFVCNYNKYVHHKIFSLNG